MVEASKATSSPIEGDFTSVYDVSDSYDVVSASDTAVDARTATIDFTVLSIISSFVFLLMYRNASH